MLLRVVDKELEHVVFLSPDQLFAAGAIGGSKEGTNHHDYNI